MSALTQSDDKALMAIGIVAFQMLLNLAARLMYNHSIGVDAPTTLFGVLTMMDTKTSLSKWLTGIMAVERGLQQQKSLLSAYKTYALGGP
jgi:hypothetical protein